MIVPPQVTSVSGKPLTIAFEEIASAKTTYHRTDPESDEEGAELEGVEAALALAEAVEASAKPEELTLSAVVDVEPADPTADADEEASGASVTGASASGDVVSEAPVSPEAVEPPAPTG